MFLEIFFFQYSKKIFHFFCIQRANDDNGYHKYLYLQNSITVCVVIGFLGPFENLVEIWTYYKLIKKISYFKESIEPNFVYFWGKKLIVLKKLGSGLDLNE